VTGDPASGDEARPGADHAKGPGIDESLRALNSARREAFDATRGTGRALRRLIAADFALARSAFGRALAWSGAAIVFGASAWLLLTSALIALMQRNGMTWVQSLSIAGLISVAAAGFCAWRVGCFFDHTGMHATRRQLTRLGLFDEHDEDPDDDPLPPDIAAEVTLAEPPTTGPTAAGPGAR
jgi:hypothetical protein